MGLVALVVSVGGLFLDLSAGELEEGESGGDGYDACDEDPDLSLGDEGFELLGVGADEGEFVDEEGHGEAYAGEEADAGDLGPGDASGEFGEAGAYGDPCGEDDAEGFSDAEAEDDAEGDGFEDDGA